MAESTCLMHSFSYTTPAFSDETHEENNPMYGIEESVSFGRYMSDNLEWEKWSSFNSNRNRYVEEAEKYSKPGSVAQKKAYFEAHFKRMAALKAAALLEQANAAENASVLPTVGEVVDCTVQDVQNFNSNIQIQAMDYGKDENVWKDGESKEVGGFVVHQNDLYSVSVEHEVNEDVEKNVNPTVQDELCNQNDLYPVEFNSEYCEVTYKDQSSNRSDLHSVPVKEENLNVRDEDQSSNQHDLYSVPISDENCNIRCEYQSAKESDFHSVPVKEENLNICNEDQLSNQNNLYSAPASDENCNVDNENQTIGIRLTQIDKPPLQKKKISFGKEASATIVKKNPPLSSYMSPTVAGTGNSAGSVYPGKENYATPVKKKSSVNDPDKKKTPLRMSINREFNRILSPVIRKIGSSTKTSKDCSTPSKTPAKAIVNSASEAPSMTPSRGSCSGLGSPAGGNKPASRWHIFSADTSMSPRNGRQRIGSPIIPSSFCLNGDRAERRKQKLEDKFNATATERAPQPSKFKEKAEAELNKFRQSFCFKAMSSPEYYREHETLKSPKQKIESSKSPKLGKQPMRSISQSKILLPPRNPSIKQNGSKTVHQMKRSSTRTKI